MSVIQAKQQEVRYIKRQNLEEESKMYQNYFRDIIHNYGVDCNYYKLKVPYPDQFRKTLDNNNILMHAYGYDANLNYDVSASIIGYMEIDQDVFNLNKYGIIPNSDVTFVFDRTEFAAKFACKMGQYKEYPIVQKDINIEIPKKFDDFIDYVDVNGNQKRYYLQDDVYPYFEACGFPLTFDSEILSGKASFEIGEYELDKEYDIPVKKYQHSDGGYNIPVNEHIYNSFYYNVPIEEYLDIFLFLKYKVSEIVVGKTHDGNDISKRVLHGTLHGSVLFHDINAIGKYIELIQPNVGDIITVGFPDDKIRERYEITESLDKNLGQDGLNPLLHKYVWKCKARIYRNSGETFPESSEANDRVQETMDNILQGDEAIAEQISKYDEVNNDAVYGGYDLENKQVDKQIVDFNNPSETKPKRVDVIPEEYEKFLDDGSYDRIHLFGDGAKLITDGYELFYISEKNDKKIIKLSDAETGYKDLPSVHWTVEGLQYIAATDDELWFKNFDNRCCKLAESRPITDNERDICMNSLIDSTYSTGEINNPGDNFYKFKNCRTILMSVNGNLYCRFGRTRKIVRIS